MKRILFAAALLGLALLPVAPASAQSQVRGRVVGPDGKAVPDANVTIEALAGPPRKYELKTNKKGEYVQIALESGNYRITATKEGLIGTSVNIRMTLGDRKELPDLQLMTPQEAVQQPGSPLAKLQEQFGAAVGLAQADKLDEAEAAFKALLEEYPDIPEIYQNLGAISARKKDWADAEANYKKALELRPGDSGTQTALASVYQQSGQADKATELINSTAQENPEDAIAQYNRGIYLVNEGKDTEAIAAFEAALAADPQKAEAHFQLGTLFLRQGKIPEAIQHLETYLSLNPTNEQNVATAKGLIQALKK